MPTGTRVDDCYQKLKGEGKAEGSAAAICQKSTGQNLHTGQPLKKHCEASDLLRRAVRNLKKK